MRYGVVIEQGEESWGAWVPDLPGCVAAGDTREAVARLVRDAIAAHLDALHATGQPPPPPRSDFAWVDVTAT